MEHPRGKKPKYAIEFLLNSPDSNSSSRSRTNNNGKKDNNVEKSGPGPSICKGSSSKRTPGMVRGEPSHQPSSWHSARSVKTKIKPRSARDAVHDELKFKCGLCSGSFQDLRLWAHHQLRFHQNENVGKRLYACNFAGRCREMFLTKSDRDSHIMSHQRPRGNDSECFVCHFKTCSRVAMAQHHRWGHHPSTARTRSRGSK